MDPTRKVLASFDGRHVAPLRTLLDAPLAEVMAEVPGPYEVAATWVLKAKAERGEIAAGVFAKLPDLTQPDAVLHVLQMVQYASNERVPDLEPYLVHKKLLVRVWAIDALARTDPVAAAPHLEAALRNPSAAMRARAKALRMR